MLGVALDPATVIVAVDPGKVVNRVWSHNTTVIIRWVGTQTLPDGAPYENHGVHIVRMRWGKVVDIDANEDSQLVAESLKTAAAHGIQEALAEPIVS